MINNNSTVISGLFSRVEIEINTACNKKDDFGKYCSYCPNSFIESIEPPQLMSDDLYKKIIEELKVLKFSGRPSFHFYGEPLLHPQIEWIINYTAGKLPNSEKMLYTNGDKLDDLKYDKLINAGVNHIAVSNHDKKDIPSRPCQTVLENFHINNKGGILNKTELSGVPCYAPTHRLIIAYNGDILLCYEDAGRINVFGNVKKESIKEIWFSDKFIDIRRTLIKGNRQYIEPCKFCNNQAHIKFGQISVNKFNIQ